MKKKYSLPGIGLAVIFLIVSFIFIQKSVGESKEFKKEKNSVAKILNFNDRLLSAREWIFTQDNWEEKKVKFEKAIKTADAHYSDAKNYGNYLLYTILVFFILIVAYYARKRIYFGLTFALSFIGLALLGQGIMNPILEMSAFKEDLTIKVYVHPDDIPYFEEAIAYIGDVNKYMGDVKSNINFVRIVPMIGDKAADKLQELVSEAEDHLSESQHYLNEHKDSPIGFDKVFPGKTYFYYQNKGIMDVISLLWEHNNKPVSIAIGTFSIIIPAVKLLFTLIMLIFSIRGAKRFRKSLTYIAKFSMADVFVVGAFLAYLSFENMSLGVEMDANVLFGLYYFIGYVLVSVVLGILLDKSIEENMIIEFEEIAKRELNNTSDLGERN